MRQACILMGSPRKDGNTAAILDPFTQTLEQHGILSDTVWLYDENIAACTACRVCQTEWNAANCCRQDGMQDIFQKVLQCDLLVLASPIYSWYCTAPMKAALDRMVYALCKYYGEQKGPSLLTGKLAAFMATCGYRPEKGADLWKEGMQRYCKHTGMRYLGMHVERHLGYAIPFMDEEKKKRAQEYAEYCCQQL